MKSIIFIFVVTTIIYECFCAPAVDQDKLTDVEEKFPAPTNDKDSQPNLDSVKFDNTPDKLKIKNSQIVDENGVNVIIEEEREIDNEKFQILTVFQTNSATGKQEIKQYKCSHPPNTQCVINKIEAANGSLDKQNSYKMK